MSNLKWTKEPPSEPGFYLLGMPNGSAFEAVKVWRWGPSSEFLSGITTAETDEPTPIPHEDWSGCLWAGPIPQPDEGEGE